MRRILRLLPLLFLLVACTGFTGDDLAEPKIVYGLTLMPSGFDPHINASSELGIPLRSVYDTLIYRDPVTGDFVPGLAERWESSADGLTHTFYLRDDVTFHDGTAFNAAAVGDNIARIISPDTGSQKARFMLGPITGYQVIDTYTIALTFSASYAPLFDALSQPYLGIASPQALAAYDNATYQFHQVGTGPFRMVEYVPGDRFVLTRNQDYAWGPEFYTLPENPVQTVEFRFFEDPVTRALALEGGDVQVMGEIQPVDAQLLSGNPAINLFPVSIPGQPLQFLMNVEKFPTDNRAVRQALLFGMNRTLLVETVFQRFSPVAYGPLTQTTDYYYDQVVNAYPYDLAQSLALLEAAGFTEHDEDGILMVPTGMTAATAEPGDEGTASPPEDAVLSGVPLKLTMIVPPWGLAPQVAQLMKSQWREVGIDLEIQQVAGFGQLAEAANSGDYNLICINFAGRDPDVLSQFFTTDASLNWTGYSDMELDTYLREGAYQTDPNTRSSMYAAAQTRIMEQALILPIRDYVNLNGATAELEGVAYDAQGWFPLLHNFGVRATNGN